jgi:hypothetical protein
MKIQISTIVLSACTALACDNSAGLPTASPSQTVEARVQPVQHAAPAPQPTAAPSAPPTASTAAEQVKVGNTLLMLEGCQLTVESSGTTRKHTLPMPDGCTFGKRKAGGPVQIEPTPRGQTVLVVSSKPQGGRDCDTHIRALVINKQGIALSSEEQEISMCGADGPFDAPMFITLAATAKPLS